MRSIKFRGKRIDNGMWVDGDLVTTLTPKGSMVTCPAIHTTNGTIGTFFVHPETVGQFTGLFDKNGKKIYEGDIVKKTTKSGYPDEYIAEIVFRDGSFGLKNNSRYGLPVCILVKESNWVDGNASGKSTYEYEIIGNVYENRNLLANRQ
nr:MAG TPA: YopX protein [Caudoviricetes sp.]